MLCTYIGRTVLVLCTVLPLLDTGVMLSRSWSSRRWKACCRALSDGGEASAASSGSFFTCEAPRVPSIASQPLLPGVHVEKEETNLGNTAYYPGQIYLAVVTREGKFSNAFFKKVEKNGCMVIDSRSPRKFLCLNGVPKKSEKTS